MEMIFEEGIVGSSEILPHTLRGGTEINHEKLLVLSMSGKRAKPEVFHLRSSRTGYVQSLCNVYTHCLLLASINVGP